MGKPIIDISEFNTITDWQRVAKNVSLVIIRMGYRSYGAGKITYDKKYKEHRAACEKYGIPHGFYFFPTSVTDKEAQNEADWVAAELSNVKTFYCPVFADSEIADVINKSGRSDSLSREDRTRLLKVFCDRLQSKGIPAGVYGSTSWLNNRLDMKQLPYSVWVAQYAAQCQYKGDYLFWQYTSRGSVPGVAGNVDISVPHEAVPVKDGLKDRILEMAASFIGTKESPANSNNVVFNTDYYGRPVSGSAYPWCCTFVWDIFRMCGASSLFYGGKKTAYCPTAMNWFKQIGRFVQSPERGDVVFFNFSGGKEATHIGIVESVQNGEITTIEGNTSTSSNENGGAVMRRHRSLKTCIGFGRPNYTQKETGVDTSAFPVIKRGSERKDYVLLLQNALTLRGYKTDCDGIFGADTAAKVMAFQKDNGLAVDGIVGAQTWNALFS